jgi:ribonuclease P protein component
VKRNFRLRQATDFKRVRRTGKSYAHPFIVLVVMPAEGERTLIGVTAGKSVGGAVERNRAKRLAREAARPLLSQLNQGWKIVLICRNPILKASFPDIQTSLVELFTKARILKASNEFRTRS